MKRINVLTIAGTDPSGGSGIQADLKTFSALKTYGTSVITALVAQNTYGVKYVYNIKPYFINMQLDSIFEDIRIDSIKIGMLLNSSTINIVAQKIKNTNVPFIVLDPVILSKNNYRLLSKEAVSKICIKLFPYVSIITPNILEAALLLKTNVANNEKEILIQGKLLLKFGCEAVLMKGGHAKGKNSTDWLITKSEIKSFKLPRINTLNTHGTGCSLSSAIAALRPRYKDWGETITVAKNWLQKALEQSNTLEVGHGIGPIHHFHEWW